MFLSRAVLPCLVAAVTLPAVPAAAERPMFDGARAMEHVRQLVSFGPRPAGSPALEQARGYIRAQLKALGVAVVDQPFDADTPVGRLRMVNLRATIPGASKDRLIIGGHYDTKLFREFRFVGANDGGSSAAFLIELARVLKARANPFTVELVFFDGEEATRPEWRYPDHTYGSRHYVDAEARASTLPTIRAMLLVDMIGDRDLNIRRESLSTKWLTDVVWNSARVLGYGRYFLNEEMAVEDDHVAFLRAGVPAVNIIDLDYPPWHTAADTIDQVSARSMEIVGLVLLDALPSIEARLKTR